MLTVKLAGRGSTTAARGRVLAAWTLLEELAQAHTRRLARSLDDYANADAYSVAPRGICGPSSRAALNRGRRSRYWRRPPKQRNPMNRKQLLVVLALAGLLAAARGSALPRPAAKATGSTREGRRTPTSRRGGNIVRATTARTFVLTAEWTGSFAIQLKGNVATCAVTATWHRDSTAAATTAILGNFGVQWIEVDTYNAAGTATWEPFFATIAC